MKIKFLQDYRGVLTGEMYFEKGAVIDTSKKDHAHIDGENLVKDSRAKKVAAGKPGKK